LPTTRTSSSSCNSSSLLNDIHKDDKYFTYQIGNTWCL
jgi:hypothetical protein